MILTDREGKQREIATDTFVLGSGATATGNTWSQLKNKFSELYFVGDSLEPRKIMEAIEEGNCAARSI